MFWLVLISAHTGTSPIHTSLFLDAFLNVCASLFYYRPQCTTSCLQKFSCPMPTSHFLMRKGSGDYWVLSCRCAVSACSVPINPTMTPLWCATLHWLVQIDYCLSSIRCYLMIFSNPVLSTYAVKPYRTKDPAIRTCSEAIYYRRAVL